MEESQRKVKTQNIKKSQIRRERCGRKRRQMAVKTCIVERQMVAKTQMVEIKEIEKGWRGNSEAKPRKCRKRRWQVANLDGGESEGCTENTDSGRNACSEGGAGMAQW